MLRYTTDRVRPGLVALYRCTTSGQETERVNLTTPEPAWGQYIAGRPLVWEGYEDSDQENASF